MARYRYKARTETGKLLRGTLESESEEEALRTLREDGVFPVLIEPAADAESRGSFFSGGRINDEDLIIFTRQLATLSKAGIPILTTLEILQEQIKNPAFRRIAGRIREDIVAGNSLSQSLAKYPRYFPRLYVNFIYAGEQGGVLDRILDRLGELLTHEMENKQAIKSALLYPKMVILAMLGAFVVIMTFVIPKFARIFSAIKMELPLPTRILLGVNSGFQNFWPYLLGGAIVLIIAGYFWLRTNRGQIFRDRYKLKIPIIGTLITRSMISRFCFVFGTTIQSGMPILETLAMASLTVNNRFLSRELGKASRMIKDGKNIGSSLERLNIFPPLVINMIAVGERSGKLPEMLTELVNYYDLQMKYAISGLARVMEQFLTAVMAVLVLILALAVFMPMWNMINLAQR